MVLYSPKESANILLLILLIHSCRSICSYDSRDKYSAIEIRDLESLAMSSEKVGRS